MWCKFDPSWASHVRITRLNRAIGDEGGLRYVVRLWGVAMSAVSSGVEMGTIEDDVEWLGDQGVLVDGLLRCGFIDRTGALGAWYAEAVDSDLRQG